MRPRPQAAVQLARPLGRAFPEALLPRFGIVRPRSALDEMREAVEAQPRQAITAKQVSTPTPRQPPSQTSSEGVAGAGRPEVPTTPAQPPRMPADRTACDRAIILLGAWCRGDTLHAKKQTELKQLIGAVPPDAGTALTWKRALKRVRRPC